MSTRNVLTAKLEVITPVFCAGADQNGPAEIRPFSVRGALRWWYRAIDSDYLKHEQTFFGAAGEKIASSPITLRVGKWVTGNQDYSAELAPQRAAQLGRAYLGYTLYLGKGKPRGNDRRAVAPRVLVELQLVQLRGSEEVRRAWAASLFLFGHLGGLGTRSRRGFGTMALTEWAGWPECRELPPAHGARTPAEWKQAFDRGVKTIRTWFQPPRSEAGHQHVGSRVDLRIWRDGLATWQEALDVAGSEFHQFRNDRTHHTPEQLAAFGLPLGSRSRKDQVIPDSGDFGRAPSRLQFRVIKIGGKYHPLVWRAQGLLLPAGVGMRWKKSGKPVPYGGDALIDRFLSHVAPRCVP